jgi:hypothetical protein
MSGGDFFNLICEKNYKLHEKLSEYSIGFNKNEGFVYFFPAIALFLNLTSVAIYFRNKRKKQK